MTDTVNTYYLLPKKNYLLFGVFWKLGLVLFFSMLFIPTTYQYERLPVLLVLMVGIFVRLVWRNLRFKIHSQVLVWFASLVAWGLFSIFWGVWNETPGALSAVTVNIFWPIVFMFFVGEIDSFKKITGLVNVIFFSSSIIVLHTFYFFSYFLGILPEFLYISVEMGQAIGFNNGLFEYRLYNIGSLVAVLPFTLAAWLYWTKDEWRLFSRRHTLVLLFFGLIPLALLSARRAFWFVALFTPFVASLFAIVNRVKISAIFRKFGVLFVAIFFSFVLFLAVYSNQFGLTFERVQMEFLSIFDSKVNLVRTEQAHVLLSHWQAKPLLGHGGGGVIPGVIRDINAPWASELVYHKILFDNGLIGLAIYFLLFIWVFIAGFIVIYKSRIYDGIMIASLTMLFGFLLANASNPYLGKFDHMWVLFFPVAIINRYLFEGR